MAYYHQGGHGGAPPLGLRNRWFTRYLYGVQNGIENKPKAWVDARGGGLSRRGRRPLSATSRTPRR